MKTSSALLAALLLSCPALALAAEPSGEPKTDKDKPVDETQEHPSEYTGLSFRGGIGIENTRGDIVPGVDATNVRVAFDLGASLAVTRHVAFEAGFLLATGSQDSLCQRGHCSYLTLSIPTRVIFHFDSRKSGPYIAVGPSLLPHGIASAQNSDGSVAETVTFRSLLGANGAVGWRFPILGDKPGKPTGYYNPVRHEIDVRLQGMYSSFSSGSSDSKSGDIGSPTPHFDLGATVAWNFSL
jgi:hypothetical protein